MSEPILQALMQLFAIIAHPESDTKDKRTVVENFLDRQLNQELVQEYLKIFDKYYEEHQEKLKEKSRRKKRTSSSSVRVLKICTEINEELTQKQKILVLIRLLEFVKSGEQTDEQEFEFIKTVAETFYIPKDEFVRLNSFVLDPFEKFTPSPQVLVINDKKDYNGNQFKHIYSDSLKGEIRILQVKSANMHLVRHIGEDELYSNSQVLDEDRIHVLSPGSSIRNSKIKPVYFSEIINSFISDEHITRIDFIAQNIEHQFKEGTIGIRNMNLHQESGQLIGIMGASGAGKSTLVNILNGSTKPTSGHVTINGIDIHAESQEVEGLIGHVSQDDLLIEELTVFQNLYYNAKLCFDNLEDEEIQKRVLQVLQNLGLYEIRDMKVGSPLNKKISGGQRKRLNIALELIREPAVLFLDEPTSGLSSRDSENIMDLLKELTLKGKLVFVVIHQPSSDIFKMFDRLIILDTGGYLIYNGDPIDSIIYFKSRIHLANWSESECPTCGNVNPEQLFNIIEAKVVDEYGNITKSRKTSPSEWNKYYQEFQKKGDTKEINRSRELPQISFKIPAVVKQFLIYAKRDILSKLSNTQYLVINLLEAPLLAFLLSFIIKYYNVGVENEFGYTLFKNSNLPVYIFMSVIVAIFMGLTVSAEEIIKDRKILHRESFLNLSWSSYLLSKIGVQFIIAAIQAFTFVMIGNSIMEIRGMYFEYWIVLFSAWCFANMTGLLISDSFKTVITIYILIPFLIIPQLILSGVIVKYEKLNPNISSPKSIPFYGEFITARWAYEALAVNQFKNNEYEEKFYYYDKVMSEAGFKKNYWLRNLENKVEYCRRNLNNPDAANEIQSNLALLRNEIEKELSVNSRIPFNQLEQLYPEKLDMNVIEAVKKYLSLLNEFYVKLYNKANSEKDKIISTYQTSEESKQEFLMLKRNHHNEELEQLVTNVNEIDRIIEFNNHLYQKIDPVFREPRYQFIKAHFYAPEKNIFSAHISTLWANVLVIWFSSFIVYVLLYYRVLRRFLESFEKAGTWFRKKE